MVYYNEKFVTDSESNESVKFIFIIMGYTVLGIIIAAAFYWAYNKSYNNQYMFIVVLSTFLLVYCIIVLSVTLVNKNALDIPSFTTMIGLTIFNMFISFFFIVFFMLKHFGFFRTTYDY